MPKFEAATASGMLMSPAIVLHATGRGVLAVDAMVLTPVTDTAAMLAMLPMLAVLTMQMTWRSLVMTVGSVIPLVDAMVTPGANGTGTGDVRNSAGHGDSSDSWLRHLVRIYGVYPCSYRWR